MNKDELLKQLSSYQINIRDGRLSSEETKRTRHKKFDSLGSIQLWCNAFYKPITKQEFINPKQDDI